ncbi:Ig-like domain-containing protein [Pontibacter sp. BT310]|uniref:Ig-like domain-containing protein n=1 Tax=Pontibacter populi TaxID=890055 RepID=A0ABS6X7X2_9BACT|nr:MULTISPECIES: Ig-like domain-containing protein [Pontibacter]MBJ6116891.1 Ig-like domain-containing protein [Pontibacter sp. BT310]MBR0569315.1 Ig-like domain-containing protein [Microvirga sp. STS03]MBW3363744.1 Ig-like domain-containing protein [Pontibacter populi]
MIKSIKLQLLLYLLFGLLLSCKEEVNMPAPEKRLAVKVVNSQNQPVPKAGVSIYTNEADWQHEQNATATVITNEAGIATITNIGSEKLWIKATWIDLKTREVFQNTLVSFEPVNPLPDNSLSTYSVKINSAKVLKGIHIKRVTYTGYIFSGCDQPYDRSDIYYCGYYYYLPDVSGTACDIYLMIENSISNYSFAVGSYVYRSEVQTDAPPDGASFEVNKTITDFRRPYYIGVREHLTLNPQLYTSNTCTNGSSAYASLGDYLASEEGQEYIFKSKDRYVRGKTPLLNVDNGIMPSYPVNELIVKSDYGDGTITLQLEWIYE